MKYITLSIALLSISAIITGSSARGQGTLPGNRLFNPFHVTFKATWDLVFKEPVKLIEIGPVTDSRRSNLVLLIGGRDSADTQRQLRVLHWDGSRFSTDAEVASQSIGVDTLLLGQFHPGKPNAPLSLSTDKPVKKKPTSGTHGLQTLTNAGVYTWNDGNLARLAAVPPDIKVALSLEGRPDQMLVGAGNGTTAFEFSATDIHPAKLEVLDGNGYARWGIGTQEFAGSGSMNLGIKTSYIQSVWVGRTKWLIALEHGNPLNVQDVQNATTGDKLVVYTPKFANRDKTFWASRPDDVEVSWKGPPMPGRVLDVRVGDPRNEGKPGILVLTAEDNDKIRHLYFFAISSVG